MPAALVRWATADAPEAMVTALTPVERERWSSFEQPADRARYLAAHLVARIAAAAWLGVEPAAVEVQQRCDRCGGPHGQPVPVVDGVVGPQLSFSHAGAVVVAAVAAVPVGVDVEPVDQPAAALAAIGEQLLGVAVADRLHRWVATEAAAKAHGTGFAVAPAAVDLTSVRLVDLDLAAGYLAVLAVRTGEPPTLDVAAVGWGAFRGRRAAPSTTTTRRTGR